MKIQQVTIHNYRSIQHADVEVPDMLVLLGPNNHGKSNLLSALEFGLSTNAKPAPEDLCAFRDGGDGSLWVEFTFTGLTPQENTTFEKYVRADGTVKLRKTADLADGGELSVGYRGYVQEPDEWWLRASAFERLNTQEKIRAEAQNVPPLQTLSEGGRITKQRLDEFQRAYIQEHRAELHFQETLEQGPLLGTKNVGGGVLPDFYLVPAVRDLSDEAKTNSTTAFGRLLQRAVQEMTARDPRFQDLHARLQQLISELNDRPQSPGAQPSEIARLEASLSEELSTWGVRVTIQVTPPDIGKILELGTALHLDDGIVTLAERKGHGLQRAVLFALLRAWAKVVRQAPSTPPGAANTSRRSSDSSYFAIEEPEIFLHPHAQRQLQAALWELATSPEHQVFVCTHSTHFVDLDHYQSIAICRKPGADKGTQIRQCTQDLFAGAGAAERKGRFHMATWVNPDRGELFFAKKVVLVEGDTEKAVVPFLGARLGCLDPEVSIIDCGGKFNIRLYTAVLNAFRIPYYVIHDEDPLPDPIPSDWPPQKVAERRRLFAENAQIAASLDLTVGTVEVMRPDFEHVSGVSGSQGEKKGKPIAALDHFASVEPDGIPGRLCEVTREAYRTPPFPEGEGT